MGKTKSERANERGYRRTSLEIRRDLYEAVKTLVGLKGGSLTGYIEEALINFLKERDAIPIKCGGCGEVISKNNFWIKEISHLVYWSYSDRYMRDKHQLMSICDQCFNPGKEFVID